MNGIATCLKVIKGADGLKTGGMGAVNSQKSLPFLGYDNYKKACDCINLTLDHLRKSEIN